jgi:DNA-binding winged helix-turn-helix (wHTH) protein
MARASDTFDAEWSSDMSTQAHPLRVRFSEFEFEPRGGELRRDGQRVAIQDQLLIVLEMLIGRAGSLVTREELCARLWPDAFIDFDNGLNNAISRLRTALHDSAAEPRFIETLGRRGYRFIAPVEPVEASPASPAVRAWLIGETGRVALVAGDNILGRRDENVLELPSSTVSRRHARITIDEHAFIEDLGSKNGTFVGSRRVTRAVKLSEGDSVRFGSLTFRFAPASVSDDTQTLTASD